MGVPNVFGSATTSIPLSQLDQNFNTTATLGNAAIGLGNVTTTVGNLTLTNVNITSGTINAAVTQSGFTGNSVIYSNTSGNLTTSANMTFDGSTLTTLNTAYTGTLTGGTGIVNLGSGQFYKDASGNVGIGTASPAYKLDVNGVINAANNIQFTGYGALLQASNSAYTRIVGGTTANTDPTFTLYGSANANAGLITYDGSSHRFRSSAATTEYMRIDSSGNLLVGVTSTGGSGKIVSAYGNFRCRAGVGGAETNAFVINWTGSPQLWIDTTNVGTLATVSDYRIKRNIQNQTAPALERVIALRPITYQMADYGDLFKSSDDIKEGFIAHELQAIIPSAVEGEKDCENQVQSLKLDALCSVMVKAIQEQQALITDLQTRLTKAGL